MRRIASHFLIATMKDNYGGHLYRHSSDFPNSWSRLDQAEITVLPLVEHSHSARLSVAKNQEGIGSRGKVQRGLFGCHRLDAVPPRVDNSHRQRCGFYLPIRVRRYDRGLARIVFSVDDSLL